MKELFNSIVKASIAPHLRQAGFTRRSLNFVRPAGEYVQIVNIQRSAFNHQDRCSFAINCGLYVPSVVETYFQENAPKHPNEAVCILRRRSGLIDGDFDLWFVLTSETDQDALKHELSTHVRTSLIPYLDALLDRSAILAAIDADPGDPQQQVFRAIFYLREGFPDRGSEALRDLVRQAKNSTYKGYLIDLCVRLNVSVPDA